MRHQRHLRFSTTIPAALTVAASILVGRCGSTISPSPPARARRPNTRPPIQAAASQLSCIGPTGATDTGGTRPADPRARC